MGRLIFAATRTPPETTNWFRYPPVSGVAAALLNASNEPLDLPLRTMVIALNEAALCGIALGIGLSLV